MLSFFHPHPQALPISCHVSFSLREFVGTILPFCWFFRAEAGLGYPCCQASPTVSGGGLNLPRESMGLCRSLQEACATLQTGVFPFSWVNFLRLKPVMFALEITPPAVENSICSHLILFFSDSGFLVQHYSGIRNTCLESRQFLSKYFQNLLEA